MFTKESVCKEIVKFADTTIDSSIQRPVQLHGEGTGILPVNSHASNSYFELVDVALDELGTILNRVEDLLPGRDKVTREKKTGRR